MVIHAVRDEYLTTDSTKNLLRLSLLAKWVPGNLGNSRWSAEGRAIILKAQVIPQVHSTVVEVGTPISLFGIDQ